MGCGTSLVARKPAAAVPHEANDKAVVRETVALNAVSQSLGVLPLASLPMSKEARNERRRLRQTLIISGAFEEPEAKGSGDSSSHCPSSESCSRMATPSQTPGWLSLKDLPHSRGTLVEPENSTSR